MRTAAASHEIRAIHLCSGEISASSGQRQILRVKGERKMEVLETQLSELQLTVDNLRRRL